VYNVLNNRGEYSDVWSFYEPLQTLWSVKYQAIGRDVSAEQRLDVALAALCSDGRRLAKDTVAKCELMCEHMAAFHLLLKQKPLAALMLCARDDIRAAGLASSAFGQVMMMRSVCSVKDSTTRSAFSEFAQRFCAAEPSTVCYGVFTKMSLQAVLDFAANNASLSPTYHEAAMLTFPDGGSGMDADTEREMQELFQRSDIDRSIQVSMRKIGDDAQAQLAAEAGLAEMKGQWSMRLGQELLNRRNLRSGDDIDGLDMDV